MEPYIYILLSFTIGILAFLSYKEYKEWRHRRMIKKSADELMKVIGQVVGKTLAEYAIRGTIGDDSRPFAERVKAFHEKKLQEALDREDYEEAARIRDLMNKQS